MIKYYEFNGNPVIVEGKKYPVANINGKEVIIYDSWKFMHGAELITKGEYNKMLKNKKASVKTAARKITRTFYKNEEYLEWKLETNEGEDKAKFEYIQNIAWKELHELKEKGLLDFYEGEFEVYNVGNGKAWQVEVKLKNYKEDELKKEIKREGFKIVGSIQPLRMRRDYGSVVDDVADTDDYPITVDEMETICPTCAKKMKANHITSIKASVVKKEWNLDIKKASLEKIASEIIAKEVNAFQVGKTIETENLRIHRFRPAIQVTDLTNAGKRGKNVSILSIYDLDRIVKDEQIGEKEVDEFSENLIKARNYNEAVGLAKQFIADMRAKHQGRVDMDEYTQKGIDVKPKDFGEIIINGKHIHVRAEYEGFSIRDLDDKNNEPTCIQTNKTSVKSFYKWVSENKEKIEKMTMGDIMEELRKNKIDYHYYCAMD
jgi:uncharacterized protein (UPF0212 family)